MIPEAAVEAAAKFIWQGPLEDHREQVMRAALEAAAPHLMALALEDAADLVRFSGRTHPRTWLRKRAQELLRRAD